MTVLPEHPVHASMMANATLLQGMKAHQKDGMPRISGISCRWDVFEELKPPTTIIMSIFSGSGMSCSEFHDEYQTAISAGK